MVFDVTNVLLRITHIGVYDNAALPISEDISRPKANLVHQNPSLLP